MQHDLSLNMDIASRVLTKNGADATLVNWKNYALPGTTYNLAVKEHPLAIKWGEMGTKRNLTAFKSACRSQCAFSFVSNACYFRWIFGVLNIMQVICQTLECSSQRLEYYLHQSSDLQVTCRTTELAQ